MNKLKLFILITLLLLLTACNTSETSTEYIKPYILLPSYDYTLNLYGYVNTDGEWIINAQYTDVGRPPTESLENVEFSLLPAYDGEKWGYINLSNEWIIPPQYTYAEYFIDGIAQVNKDEYIDILGKNVKAKQTILKKESLTPIEQNNKWGYINQNNNIIIGPKYDDCRPFSEGLAAVLYQGQWGFINEKDKWVIAPKFDSVDTGRYGLDDNLLIFKDGLALSRNNENQPILGENGNELVRIGFINKQGEWAITPQFGITTSSFSMGVACVTDVPSYEEWYFMNGYIDKNGKVIAKWISHTNGTREIEYGKCLNPYENKLLEGKQ